MNELRRNSFHEKILRSCTRELPQTLENAKKWIRSNSDDQKYQAIQDLAWLGDNRAIPPLLEVVGSGQARWANAALDALKHYSTNIVASDAHQMQRDGNLNIKWADVQRWLSFDKRSGWKPARGG